MQSGKKMPHSLFTLRLCTFATLRFLLVLRASPFALQKHPWDCAPALGDSCQSFLAAIVFEVQMIRTKT